MGVRTPYAIEHMAPAVYLPIPSISFSKTAGSSGSLPEKIDSCFVTQFD